MHNKPYIIKGGTFNDDRGGLRYVNDFSFENIRRFYFINHPKVEIIRAWQGHEFERKYFYPIKGSFVVAWVKIDNFENPSKDLKPEFHILSSKISEIISIPKGYANGLKALESDSEVMVMSDFDLKESIKEKHRYPSDWWFDWKSFSPNI